MNPDSTQTNSAAENVDPNVAAATPSKGKDDVSAANNAAQAKEWSASDKSATVSSLQDLRDKSPELFKSMMQGIAQQICKDMRESQERLKKNLRGQ